MRCYYDVLEIPSDTQLSGEELRRQYKKLALRYHPDKNVGKEEEATARFMELNHAYSILSDSRQKRWYDEHREEVLRASADGGVTERLRGRPVDVWPLFSYRFDPSDFFEKFGKVFVEVHEAEVESSAARDGFPKREDPPPLGDESSPAALVRAFYSYWSSFNSCLSFAWEDVHDTTDAPNRAVRRCVDFPRLQSINSKLGFSKLRTRDAEIRAEQNTVPQ